MITNCSRLEPLHHHFKCTGEQGMRQSKQPAYLPTGLQLTSLSLIWYKEFSSSLSFSFALNFPCLDFQEWSGVVACSELSWHRHPWIWPCKYVQPAFLLFAVHLKIANCTVARTPRSRCCRWPAATNSEPTEFTDTSARHIRNHLF